MGSRSEGKAMDAIEEIKKEAPEGDIRFVQMDLQKLETVVEVAKEIRR
jgi:ribulose bisphosphate carboxylase small subunit